MNKKGRIFLVLAFIAVVVLSQECQPGCEECDPEGIICFACATDKETDVFGGCHDNTIDKCTIYGPSG